MGSQWRLHPLPAADRTVPGSTPSRRRVTQDDPISGGKGVRRHCGRNTGIAVALMQEKMQECKRTKDEQPGPTKTPDQNTDRTETPPREPNTDHNPARTATRKKTKKSGAGAGPWGRCRGRCTDRCWRACPGRRNTRGTPNQKGLGFPSA